MIDRPVVVGLSEANGRGVGARVLDQHIAALVPGVPGPGGHRVAVLIEPGSHLLRVGGGSGGADRPDRSAGPGPTRSNRRCSDRHRTGSHWWPRWSARRWSGSDVAQK